MADSNRLILAQFDLDVGNDDGGAMLGEEAGTCFPKAAGSAGDDRNLSLQPADMIGVGNNNLSM